jgi:hypothetical protein
MDLLEQESWPQASPECARRDRFTFRAAPRSAISSVRLVSFARAHLNKGNESRCKTVRTISAPQTVDFGTASDCSLRGLKQCVFSVGESGYNRGFWYSPLWSGRYTRLTIAFADFSGIRFTHLRLQRRNPFLTTGGTGAQERLKWRDLGSQPHLRHIYAIVGS